MNSIIEQVMMAAWIVALLFVSTGVMPSAYSSATIESAVTEFLSNVVRLDMTKYVLIQPSSQDSTGSGVSKFGGLVEEEVSAFKFEAVGSIFDTMSLFYNGHMSFIKVYPQGNDYIYSEPQTTNTVEKAKNILQRYKTYVTEMYAADNSYLLPMQTFLNSINELSPTNTTDGNVNFQVSKDGDYVRIQWIYFENGILMNYKRVDLSFVNNTFVSFRDNWRLYRVGGFSIISSDEAVRIALEAAQNVELRIGSLNGETEIVKVPDLSNAPTDVAFTMVPYRYQENHYPSLLPRDPLTLYPFWQIHFYFNESVAGNVGVQVGVWGDTKEIIYASGYGYYGASDVPSGEDKTNLQDQFKPLSTSTLVLTVGLLATLTISVAVIVVRKKNRNK